LELGGRAPEKGKIVAVVQAMNLLAAVSLAVDFKNGADKQFGRKLFDCEANGVRRRGKSSVPKSLMGVFAAPRWKELRLAAKVERAHSALRRLRAVAKRRMNAASIRDLRFRADGLSSIK
jgi:hypothetical protein